MVYAGWAPDAAKGARAVVAEIPPAEADVSRDAAKALRPVAPTAPLASAAFVSD